MKRNISLILTSLSAYFLLLGTSIHAVNITVPTPNPDGMIVEAQSPTITPDQNIFWETIQFVNEYLWLFLIVVAFGVIVYTGFLLMTSPDEDGFKKIGKMLLSVVMGILVAIFAYVIVRLLANLF